MKKFSFLLLITRLLIQPIASALALAKTLGNVESQAQAALWYGGLWGMGRIFGYIRDTYGFVS